MTKLSTFQVNCPNWPGTAKAIEEMGELLVELGKLQACGGLEKYPWGDRVFKDTLEEEIADVIAVLTYMVAHNDRLDEEKISARVEDKFNQFKKWAEK